MLTSTVSRGVLDRQRTFQEIGRIRPGHKVPTGKTDRRGNEIMRPEALARWRFTSASRLALADIAAKLGGNMTPWERNQFQVLTDADELFVTIPPKIGAITQAYEMFTPGQGTTRRCDSQVESKSGGKCLCPHAEDPDDEEAAEAARLRRAELAAMNPPKACKLVTRVNVVLPDIMGVGYWMLKTGSVYAAGEMLSQAQVMEIARDAGFQIPARLWLRPETRLNQGKVTNFHVPTIELLTTYRAIVTGELAQGGLVAQLPPAPGEQRLAITGGGQQAAAIAGPEAPAPAAPAAVPPGETEVDPQAVADDAAVATTREEVEALGKLAKQARVKEDHIRMPGSDPEEWCELGEYLAERWRALASAGDGPQQRAPSPVPAGEAQSMFEPGEWPDEAR